MDSDVNHIIWNIPLPSVNEVQIPSWAPSIVSWERQEGGGASGGNAISSRPSTSSIGGVVVGGQGGSLAPPATANEDGWN